jgi:hypothetical protein
VKGDILLLSGFAFRLLSLYLKKSSLVFQSKAVRSGFVDEKKAR